jgi:S-(hydroxymethyl)glutathione dehydrogenase/alcohol dehydrogenase
MTQLAQPQAADATTQVSSRRAKAVVCRGVNEVRVEEIEVDAPQHGEVMVKMFACGICHSDMNIIDGSIPAPMPVVIGHEGAGSVVAVGPGVEHLRVGDHVVNSFVSICGKCRYCIAGRPSLCDQAAKSAYTLPSGALRTRDSSGAPLHVLCGLGAMAEYATMHVDNVVKVDADVPLDRAALVSCGVMTGVGAATNAAQVEPGTSCVVFGCGGVGLNAIQGCAISGAAMIVAVDTSDFKLELARQFGATHTINAKTTDNIVKALRKLTGGGADYCFECVGHGETVAQAYGALGKGGTAVVVGVAKSTDMTSIRTMTLPFEAKRLIGTYYGDARPQLDFPRLLNLYKIGKLKIDELITRTYGIDEAAQAFADLKAGRNARGVIIF